MVYCTGSNSPIHSPFVLGDAVEKSPDSLCMIIKFSARQICNTRGEERGLFLPWRDGFDRIVLLYRALWTKKKKWFQKYFTENVLKPLLKQP